MLTRRLVVVVGAACLLLGTLLVLGAGTNAPASGQDWTLPDLGMEFVWIPALACWVGKYEVTNGEYRKYDSWHDSSSYQGNYLNAGRQPVVWISLDDATEYAEWLTKREQKAGRIPAGYRYRLPTADEWTAFSQCGDGRAYPWGEGMPPKYGNYCGQESKGIADNGVIDGWSDDYIVSCPVEKSGKNDWGLYGVGGNAWELTVKSSSDLSFDAWRGASWYSYDSRAMRSSYRFNNGSTTFDASGDSACGFRLVLSR